MHKFIIDTPEKWAVEPNHQRLGQFIMNELYKVRPDLHEAVTGTNSDPFYQDSRIQALWDWLIENW